jgi:MerR family mercuric resistance operon transcriptional regulator
MLTIAKFAEAGNVGVETVRFYQRKGLLNLPSREAGMRRYDDKDLRRLLFIRKAQAAGFTLEEIRELLDLDLCSNRQRAHQLATSRIEALDKKIAELQHARDVLVRLATRCSEGGSGPCPILESFGV